MLARRNGEPMTNAQLDNIEGPAVEDTIVVRLVKSRVDGLLPGMTDRIQWIDKYIDRDRER